MPTYFFAASNASVVDSGSNKDDIGEGGRSGSLGECDLEAGKATSARFMASI